MKSASVVTSIIMHPSIGEYDGGDAFSLHCHCQPAEAQRCRAMHWGGPALRTKDGLLDRAATGHVHVPHQLHATQGGRTDSAGSPAEHVRICLLLCPPTHTHPYPSHPPLSPLPPTHLTDGLGAQHHLCQGELPRPLLSSQRGGGSHHGQGVCCQLITTLIQGREGRWRCQLIASLHKGGVGGGDDSLQSVGESTVSHQSAGDPRGMAWKLSPCRSSCWCLQYCLLLT